MKGNVREGQNRPGKEKEGQRRRITTWESKGDKDRRERKGNVRERRYSPGKERDGKGEE